MVVGIPVSVHPEGVKVKEHGFIVNTVNVDPHVPCRIGIRVSSLYGNGKPDSFEDVFQVSAHVFTVVDSEVIPCCVVDETRSDDHSGYQQGDDDKVVIQGFISYSVFYTIVPLWQ